MENKLFPLYRILIVDDEISLLEVFEKFLKNSGINNIMTTSNGERVYSLIERYNVKIVLLDLNMPELSGIEILKKITINYPEVITIIVTSSREVKIAVNCMKNGAYDYILKSVGQNQLVERVKKAIEFKNIEIENKLLKDLVLKKDLKNPEKFNHIITNNEKMLTIFRYFEAIWNTNEPIFIIGETGVGKELFAQAFCNISKKNGKFIKVNVAGLDDQMFSDTLFGHKKGAFTDAFKDRKGLIEKADGGVIFLDEIGDLTLPSQIKLLRLIQEHEYYQLGSDEVKTTDVLIIAATNKNIKELQIKDKFRQDLFYRLNTHTIEIPPLRERKDDIPLLVDFFIKKIANELGKKAPTVPKELDIILKNYYFPGNIRELRSMIYEAISLHKSKIMSMNSIIAHITKNTLENTENIDEVENFNFPSKLPTLKDMKEQLIVEALRRSNNNQTIAAKMIGISRQAINKKLNN